jgi:hypothetical protein
LQPEDENVLAGGMTSMTSAVDYTLLFEDTAMRQYSELTPIVLKKRFARIGKKNFFSAALSDACSISS